MRKRSRESCTICAILPVEWRSARPGIEAGRRLSGGDGLMAWGCLGCRRYHDDESVFDASDLPVAGGAQSVGTSQPDRFCRMVEFRACGGYVGPSIPASVCERACRIFGRLWRARCHWRSPGRAGSRKAAWRTGVRSDRVACMLTPPRAVQEARERHSLPWGTKGGSPFSLTCPGHPRKIHVSDRACAYLSSC